MIHSINHEFVHCCYNFDRPNYEMKTYLSLAIDSFMNLEKIFFRSFDMMISNFLRISMNC